MLSSESVSKGYFLYQPKHAKGKHNKKSKVQCPNPFSSITSRDWHKGFSSVWENIEMKLNNLEDNIMLVLLQDIVSFIHSSSNPALIPTVLLLTGVNLPDHSSLFSRLKLQLENDVTPHIAMLSSSNCSNLKQTVEQIVAQFLNRTSELQACISEEEMDVDNDSEDNISIKKSMCTLPHLADWYSQQERQSPNKKKLDRPNKKLVIIFKDFEGFQQRILHNLILILSGYLDRLPFVLVFGVATTEAAIGESLTHKITSRLMLKVFQSQPSVYFLNNTLDKVFLTPECPFQLSGKLLKFFTDVFLFYDFSVNRFTQGLKFCVMDHFYENEVIGLLCQERSKLEKNISQLDNKLLEEIKGLSSFKKYLEDHTDKNNILSDVKALKKEILSLMISLRDTVAHFYISLKILKILVKDLPQAPLGKQLRELYCLAMCKDISKTTEFKECIQFLKFISKDDLQKKMYEIQNILEGQNFLGFEKLSQSISTFLDNLENIGLNPGTRSPTKSPTKIDLKVRNRAQLKQKLAEIGARPQVKVGYEALREKIIHYLMEDFLPGHLLPYVERTVLWEVITVRDIHARNKVVPRIRAPVHTALNNPHHYLMCKCCEITDEYSILPTMPDICIAYKLHLEGGPLINVYDWLQSFSIIVDSNKEKDNPEDVNETVQARFTQAVAELEFLGFIKSSKSKPDHVSRLTWGSTSS